MTHFLENIIVETNRATRNFFFFFFDKCYKKLLHSTIQLKVKHNYTTNGFLPMMKDEFVTHYLIEFHKILCIKFPVDLWLKCCLHFIEFVPYHIFEPGMSLVKVPMNFSFTSQNNIRMKSFKYNRVREREHTLIWSAPPVPSLCSTSQSNLQIRSFASGVNLASSGNFK